MDDLTNFFQRNSKAINLLLEHKETSLFTQAMTLSYKLIDNFSYLEYGIKKNRSSRDRYASWCDKYLLKHLKGVNNDLSSYDLWCARCALLHNGASRSSHNYSNDYSYSNADYHFPSTDKFKDFYVINVISFNDSLYNAINDCIKYNDANKTRDFFNRVNNIFSKTFNPYVK